MKAYATFLRLGKELVGTGKATDALPDNSEFTVAYFSVELLASPPVRAAAEGYY